MVKIDRLKRNQKSFSCQVEYEEKKGEYKWVTVFSSVLRSAGLFSEAQPTADMVEDMLTDMEDLKFHLADNKIVKFVIWVVDL